MRKPLVLLATAAIGLLVLPPGCSGCWTADTCQNACEALACCGLLPSPLGAGENIEEAVDDCATRCSKSADDVQGSVFACVDEDAGAADCPAVERRRWSETCDEIATCLVTRVSPNVLGITELDVEIASRDYATAEICDAIGAESIEIGILQARHRFVLGGACQELTSSATVCATGVAPCEGLEPGPARVFLTVRGVPVNGCGGAGEKCKDYCKVIKGRSVVLAAGGVEPIRMDLDRGSLRPGAAVDCEGSYASCHNGQDDDEDGLADCLDPKCAIQCVDEGLGGSAP